MGLCLQDVSRLWWCQCVCVGQSVCVTALRVCVLRGWRGNNILCVTDQSEIHTDYTPRPENENHTHQTGQSVTPPMMSHSCGQVEVETRSVQSGARLKESRVISYQVRAAGLLFLPCYLSVNSASFLC